jgi:hypothetical protein
MNAILTSAFLALIPAGNIPPQFPNAKLYLLPDIHPAFDPAVANVKPILHESDPRYQFRNEHRETYSDTPPHFVRERSVYLKNSDGGEKLLHTLNDSGNQIWFSGGWANPDGTLAFGNVIWDHSGDHNDGWIWTESGGLQWMSPFHDFQTGLTRSFLDGSQIPTDLLYDVFFSSVYGVSDDGRWIYGSAQITPTSEYPHGHHLYYLDLGPSAGGQPTPEPTTLAVLAIAGVSVVMRRWSRKLARG